MNEGCIPTKTLLRSAEVMHLVRERAYEFGVRGIDTARLSFDLASAISRKNVIVQGIIEGIHSGLSKTKNITFLRGRAEFTSPVDIRVDGKHITAEKSVLAVGACERDVSIQGLEEAGYITNNEALMLESLPSSMIIIGGGYVGVEFAQMYARFGTKVTLLGRAPRIMRNEEPDLSRILEGVLSDEGIDLHTGATVLRAGKENGVRYVVAATQQGEQRFQADVILLAAGRIARVDNLGLQQAGVELDGKFLLANDKLQTSAENIWSLGDANGGYMFTHRATYDGPIVALNAVKGLNRLVDYRVVPRAIFTDPALASVGVTEEQAHQSGIEVKVGTALFAQSGRAKALSQTEGMVKLIADAKTGVLLGGHILGPHADDLIHEVVIAMYNHGTIEALAKSIHVHPTLPEVVKNAAKAMG